MKLASLLLSSSLLLSTAAHGEDPIRIEIGKSYDGYSNAELKRRVWQLERAVMQLQHQVFALAMRDGTAEPAEKPLWTCRIQTFGKTMVESGTTRAATMANLLQKCSDASNAVHCHESDVKCDNR